MFIYRLNSVPPTHYDVYDDEGDLVLSSITVNRHNRARTMVCNIFKCKENDYILRLISVFSSLSHMMTCLKPILEIEAKFFLRLERI